MGARLSRRATRVRLLSCRKATRARVGALRAATWCIPPMKVPEGSYPNREIALIRSKRPGFIVTPTRTHGPSMLDLSALPAAQPATLTLLAEGVLALLLIAAMASDLRTFRIPNRLTYGGAVAGLALSAWTGHALSGIEGLGLGLALLLPLWMLRVLGAGDVKLMGVVGAFVGFPEIIGAALMCFIAGGVLAVGYSIWLKQTGRMLRNVQEALVASAFAVAAGQKPELAAMPSIGKLPYGLGIGAGSLAWLVYRHFV